MNYLRECVKCYLVHSMLVLFVALLGRKYMGEGKTRNRFDKIPKALSVVRRPLDNL